MKQLIQKNKVRKNLRGAASYYIVAFSTLILVVIATSFATVIISEISRTSNDDLSQSAYDSALAGVEDAKVAFSNYRRCAETGATAVQPVGNGTTVTCSDIMWWMEHPDCYMVGHILGKIGKNEEAEVTVGGTIVTSGSTETTTNQAYTCTIINTDLIDYRATLTADNKRQTMRGSVGNGPTNEVKKVRVSWYSVRNDISLKYTNFNGTRVAYPTLTGASIATPPTVEFQLVQTGQSFKLSDFDIVESGRTNRGTLFLVPTSDSAKARSSAENYIGIYNGTNNVVSATNVVKTNDHAVSNKSFLTYCDANSTAEFYCSVEIELPGVIGGGARNNSTFMLSIALPYQQPDTDFSIELICDSGACGTAADAFGVTSDAVTKISNTQVSIDSTGRANDLYRRVETRLETADTTFGSGSPYYALQILGSGTTEKKMKVMSEYNFYF